MTLRQYLLSLFSLLLLAALPLRAFSADTFTITIDSSQQAGSSVNTNIQFFHDGIVSTGYTGTVALSATTSNGQPVNLTPTAISIFNGSSGTFPLVFKTAGEINLSCVGSGGKTGSTSTTITFGPATHLLLVFPGLTHTPGFTPGVSPTSMPILSQYNFLVGSYYPLTAYATDDYYNWVTSTPLAVTLDTTSVSINAYTNSNDGKNFFIYNYKINGAIAMNVTTSTPSLTYDLEYAQYVSMADKAYIHLVVPGQAVAGSTFSVTATAEADAGGIIPNTNGDFFRVYPYVYGSSTLATGGWDGMSSFTTDTTGKYIGGCYYKKAETIYLKAEKTNSSGIDAEGVPSAGIVILPDVPASFQYSLSPTQIQAKHTCRINVTVFDQYGNTTRSNLYPFVINFTQTSGNGYLSVTQTATSNGYAYCDYTGGTVNEVAQIQIDVKNVNTGETYATQTASVQVSVAKVEVGAITNYPNPFNPGKGQSTSINYYLESPSNVDIKIYDPFGRLVLAKSLSKDDASLSQSTSSGGASWSWDGRNGAGRVVGNGIYLVKIIAHGDKEQEFKRRVGVLK